MEVKLSTGNYYGGTSGLVLPVPNKSYYPTEFKERSRLYYYSSLFNSIEVNSSFYKIPQASTISKWSNDVTNDLRFTFKLWRGITHEKGLLFNHSDINRFIHAINAVEEKKGCLLMQFPPSLQSASLPQLTELVNDIRDADPQQNWKLAMEFRHSSWYKDPLREFAANNNLSIVLQDMPKLATPLDFVHGDTVYLRFHGPGGKYRGSYPDDVLQEYSIYIHEWKEDGKTVYTYFNNTMGDAVKNLATLKRMIDQLSYT